MKVACFLLVFCVAFIYKADCLVTGWTNPLISGLPSGSATLALDDGTTGATEITIAATTNSTTVSYAVLSQDPTTGGTFTIAADTGILSVTGTIDYETHTEYVLKIEATEDASNKGTATVTVSIADINDNDPAFGSAAYTFTICDLAPAGTVLTTLTATDADGTSPNNVISGYAISVGNTNTDFAMSASGVITVVNPLDKSVTDCYNLTLEVTDSGTPPSALTGTTVANVCVEGSCSGAAALISGAIITTMTILVARFL